MKSFACRQHHAQQTAPRVPSVFQLELPKYCKMLLSQSTISARSEVCSLTHSQPLLRSQHIVGPSPLPKTIPCLSGVRSINGLGCSSAAKWQPSRRTSHLSAAIQQQSVENQPKEAHKIFDEVQINVKSGHGGTGEIVEAGKGKPLEAAGKTDLSCLDCTPSMAPTF